MQTNKFFPLGDRLTTDEFRGLFGRAPKDGENWVSDTLNISPKNIKAVYTGEKRCPRKGEWYLSGAIVAAYRAPNDLLSPYHIAKLVRTETKTIEFEVQPEYSGPARPHEGLGTGFDNLLR